MPISNGTIDAYLEAVCARRPTPGGGSVAALVGAAGAALTQMVGRYTGGKKYAAVESQAQAIVADAQQRLAALRRYVEEDCTAYDTVSAAMGLPKETDEQKTARKAAMQDAFCAAMAVPLETCRECLKLLGSLRDLVPISNPNVVSDVGVAVLLTTAAFEGAKLNVDINLASIRDAGLVSRTRSEVNEAHAQAVTLKDQILAQVLAALGTPTA